LGELNDVGTDLREHVATGNHLSNAQHFILIAAVGDASLEAGLDGVAVAAGGAHGRGR